MSTKIKEQRDAIALVALGALISKLPFIVSIKNTDSTAEMFHAIIAAGAYSYADAMLKQRGKGS